MTETELELITTEIKIGGFWLREPYEGIPSKIAIYKESGEGGDFDVLELEAVIAKFYKERF